MVVSCCFSYSTLKQKYVISRLKQSQGLLYKHLHHSFSHSVMVCENIFTAPPCPNGLRWCFQFKKNQTIFQFLEDSKSQRASKVHYWFKSYSDFAEWVEFAYWWSFSGEGSAPKGVVKY